MRGSLSIGNRSHQPPKWLFFDHFWPLYCQLCVNRSQNCGSDGHFEVLTLMGSKVMTKNAKNPNAVFLQNCKKTEMEIFAV